MKPKKVALAYSGGLDTSIIIPWLKENYQCEVVAVCGDVGQGGDELAGLEEKALKTGASEVYVADLREEFITDYLWRMVRAGGVYEHKYLLGTSIARPLLAKRQVEVALETGCDAPGARLHRQGQRPGALRADLQGARAASDGHRAVARVGHRLARGRHRVCRRAQRADLSVHHQDLQPRPQHLAYLARRRSARGSGQCRAGRYLDADEESAAKRPTSRPKSPSDSRRACPSRSMDRDIDGARSCSRQLNQIGAEHGIGRIDLVENRFVGMKSRGCYETPGGTLIMAAHRELEALTLDKNTLHYKQRLALDYAEMVYNGLWFTPLREALDAFFERHRAIDHRRGHAAALQGQYRAGQPQVAVFAVLARHRQLHDGRKLRSEGRARLHQPDRTADQGAGRLMAAQKTARKTMKLWGGRFEAGPSEVFERFSGSLHFDRRLIDADIRGLAGFCARAGARRHSHGRENATAIVEAFEAMRGGSAAPDFFAGATDEDVHTLVIRKLKERVGRARRQDPYGPQPQRAGLARRPAVAARRVRRDVARRSPALMESLLELGERYPDAVIPGYTHLRRAQAVLWPHYLLAYFEMLSRDWERFGEARRARQRAAARLRRIGRQRLSVRSRSHRARSRLRGRHRQQHGRLRRPRFRAGLPLCRHGHDAASEPPGRRLDPVFERGVRLDGARRRRHQRIEPDAAEEESRFAGADPR